MRRGQVAIEYFIVMAVVIIISMVYLVISAHAHQRTIETAAQEELNDIVQYLQDEFIVAAQVRDGYSRTIHVPSIVQSQPYSLVHSQTIITLQQQRASASRSVPEFTGNISFGTNILAKQNGVITIS